jgi:hypothetical protein
MLVAILLVVSITAVFVLAFAEDCIDVTRDSQAFNH